MGVVGEFVKEIVHEKKKVFEPCFEPGRSMAVNLYIVHWQGNIRESARNCTRHNPAYSSRFQRPRLSSSSMSTSGLGGAEDGALGLPIWWWFN
jgi:hypothetical protein